MHPQAQNPEVGIGDLFKLAQALAEAVLTGSTEVPVVTMRVAGKKVKVGPIPITITA